MKRLLKKLNIAVLGAFLLLMLCCPVTASAAKITAFIFDEGARLSTEEYNECLSRIQEAADNTGMNVGVVLGVQERTDITIDSVAKHTYIDLFSDKTDGILYYMDLKGHDPHDFIYTSGLGAFCYTNSGEDDRISSMFRAMDIYLYSTGNEDVKGALAQFAEDVEYYRTAGIPEHYYYYNAEEKLYYSLDEDGRIQTTTGKPYRNASAILLLTMIGFITGLILALIVYFSVRERYRFKTSLTPTNYVNRKAVEFNRQYDKFVTEHTSKVKIGSSAPSSGSQGTGKPTSGGGHNR